MVFHAELIVLSFTKIKENALVLHCLSREWGRRGFITSVPKNAGTALFQPLSILDAEVVENPRSDLWRLRGISAKYGLNGIRSSMAKNSMTMFMSEVLYRTIHDGDTEDGLYDWCRRSILTLDALEGDYANYHLRFLLEFAAALGFSPSTEDLAPFSGSRSREIAALAGADFSSCMLLPLSGQARGEIAGQLLKYLEFHTGEQLNIRSLAVLRELYGK